MLFKSKQNQHYLFVFLTLLMAYLISNEVIGNILFDNNVVQDDFRQSGFWIWRFWDPELFKNSFFTEMYVGHLYRTPLLFLIYRVAPFFTDNLVFFSKLLALIIGILSSLFAYLYMEKLHKDRLLALIFAFTVAITVWCTDHVSAASTRSFVWLGILSYLYFKHQRKHLSASIVIFLNLMLSPITFLICMGMEAFDFLKTYKTKILQFKAVVFWSLILNGILVLVLYLIIFKDIHIQGVGDLFTLEEMKQQPEFNLGGRVPVFGLDKGSTASWWTSEHWGAGFAYLPIGRLVIFTAYLLGAYTLINYKKLDFKLIANSSPALLFYSSLSLHFLAYTTFPLIYFPSRYVSVPLLILSLIILNFIFKEIMDKVKAWNQDKIIYYFCILACSLTFYLYFHRYYHPRLVSINPELRKSLLNLPKDSVIAGHPMSPGLNVATITAKRVVFIDSERSMAYSAESLNEIRRRNLVALAIVYAEDKETIIRLMDENNITHIFADGIAYGTQYLAKPFYMEPYNQALRSLVAKNNFYLRRLLIENKSKGMIISKEGIIQSETR